MRNPLILFLQAWFHKKPFPILCRSTILYMMLPVFIFCSLGFSSSFSKKKLTTSDLNLFSPNAASIIVNGNIGCAGEAVSFTAVDDGPGATYTWDFGPSATPNTAAGIGPHDVVFSNAGTATVTLYVTQGGNTTSDQIVMYLSSNFTFGGQIGYEETECGKFDPDIIQNIVAANGGSGGFVEYEWESSNDQISWTIIGGATNASFDPPLITSTTYYRRKARRAPCTSFVYSNIISKEIIVNLSDGGVIGSGELKCESYNPDIILELTAPSGYTGGGLEYQWQIDNGSGWVTLLGNSGVNYDPSTITTTTLYRRQVRLSACQEWVNSNTVVKKVTYELTDGGQIGTDEQGCDLYTPQPITNVVTPGDFGDVILYQWEQSMDNGFSWGIIPGANADTYAPTAISISTLYRRLARRQECALWMPSNEIEKQVINSPNITDVFSTDPTCTQLGQISIITFEDPNTIEFNIGDGTGWHPGMNTFSNLSGGIYNLSIRYLDGSCKVNAPPVVLQDPPALSYDSVNASPESFCASNDGTLTLTLANLGTSPYSLTYMFNGMTINAGTFNSNPIILSNLPSGTYTNITLEDDNECTAIEPSIIINAGNCVDTDNDGISDILDLDSDNDGILDTEESCGSGVLTWNCLPGNPSSDMDGDGILNYQDPDFCTLNAQGVCASLDNDMDGVPNYLDLDSDNDGLTDFIESKGNASCDVDGNGIGNAGDVDGDGLVDCFDNDNTDGPLVSGCVLGTNCNLVNSTSSTSDPDNDGVSITLDSDQDGLPNFLDLDSDNDGLSDLVETENDNFDQNKDGTLTPLDGTSGIDLDGDGIGILLDGFFGFGAGINSQSIPLDTDNDGIEDYLDLDSDNDGIPDLFENGKSNFDTNLNGYVDATDSNGGDTDKDGIANVFDSNPNFGANVNEMQVGQNKDADGQANHLDLDSDNDGLADVVEYGFSSFDANLDAIIDGGDSDNDGLFDAIDNFTGFGGIANDFVIPTDFDQDNIADFLDLDSDNDGLADIFESNAKTLDTNGNGVLDAGDNNATDSDNDGLLEMVDGNLNFGALTGSQDFEQKTDTDNQPNHLDLDSDNDGITDLVEYGLSNLDTNNNGLFDSLDANGQDNDNDGLVNAVDANPIPGGANNSQSIINDFDLDGIENRLDLDSDNDGIADIIESENHLGDTNQNGTIDLGDTQNLDTDSDGIMDAVDGLNGVGDANGSQGMNADFDLDGQANFVDLDSDNDAIPDVYEGLFSALDTNRDGILSALDANGLDSDNDGLVDGIDSNSNFGGSNGSQILPTDFDLDNQQDYIDLDSDNDGITDIIEGGNLVVDTNADGILNLNDGVGSDTDGDGLVDGIDGLNSLPGATPSSFGNEPDFDLDGTKNFRDLDSDNDGIADVIENGNANFDTNGNGILDSGDTNGQDTDGDGLVNVLDNNTMPGATFGSFTNPKDADNDGLGNYTDLDADNDGIPDVVEGGNASADTNGDGIVDGDDANGIDTDGDGILDGVDGLNNTLGAALGTQGDEPNTDAYPNPDWLDLDSDNDGLGDLIENGNLSLDTNGNGVLDSGDANGNDSDQDGIVDALDNENTQLGSTNNTLNNILDTDQDGIYNFKDLDSDNDGIADLAESDLFDLDLNKNGVLDGVDTDFDGFLDVVDGNNLGFGALPSSQGNPLDSDQDNVPNYLDLDSDNDGLMDVNEAGNGSVDTNDDGFLSNLDTNGGDADLDGFVDGVDGILSFGALNNTQNNGLNFDNDSTPNYLDLDSDNDGLTDVLESGNLALDLNQDGTLELINDGQADSDQDGIMDIVDNFNGFGDLIGSQNEIALDFDGDFVPNHHDLDSDNDGISDLIESLSTGLINGTLDGNNDGLVDGTDTDLDGIQDAIDNYIGFGNNDFGIIIPENMDGDGNENYLDIDSDNDGIVDNTEGQPTDGVFPLTDDYKAPLNIDADQDGIDSQYDLDDISFGGGFSFIPEDTDNDNIADLFDVDSDNHGESDFIEAYDLDNDGVADFSITSSDSDSDGLLDVFDSSVSSDPTNGGTMPSDFPNLDNPIDPERDWREILRTAPIAISDIENTLENVGISANLISNDLNFDNDLLTVVGFSLSSSGPFFPTLNIPGEGQFTLTNAGLGTYDFIPLVGFIGTTTTVYYQVCDGNYCSKATLQIEVIDDAISGNISPIANNDHYYTPINVPLMGNIMTNDFDPDQDPIYLQGNYPRFSFTPNGGVLIIYGNGSFSYNPATNFSGEETIAYTLCDGTSNNTITGCDPAILTIKVGPSLPFSNLPPFAADDAFVAQFETTLTGNVRDNDPSQDPDGDVISISLLTNPINGMLSFNTITGAFQYLPNTNYFGPDAFTYLVCDGVSGCDTATVYLTVMPEACIDIELYVYLQGPFDPVNMEMKTDLNVTRKLLPGQMPVNPLVTPTPAGNPYRGAPWNYAGTTLEESFVGPYDPNVVDWLLIRFRTGINPNTEFKQANALLYKDGRVEFLEPCVLKKAEISSGLRIVIEHRNHMGIMSDTLVVADPISDKLSHDFRYRDSYRVTGFGEVELVNQNSGIFGMYAGDSNQSFDVISYDINNSDLLIFNSQFGLFDVYSSGDLDLNGDVNNLDYIIWNGNQGISSIVPK